MPEFVTKIFLCPVNPVSGVFLNKKTLHFYLKIEDMQQCLEETQASEKKAKEDVVYLEKRLKHLLETAVSVDTSARDNDEEKITSLHLRISELGDEKVGLEQLLV